MTSTTNDILHAWANDPHGPVALQLRQELLPVEGRGGVFFPPTYADVGYNIDTLSDGTRIALVDSVGSQANRMEPLFMQPELAHLVPQVDVCYGDKDKGTDGSMSLLQAGHRLGDALVRCTELRQEAHDAFVQLLRRGDATALARLAPTSLVFGVWDSRDTMAKVARIVQSVIRAHDVSKLTRSAQYTPALDYTDLEVFSEDEKQKAEGKSSSPLAERGYVHVPATESLGGVIASGPIQRDVTVNLIALRRLKGKDSDALRSYVLGLALVAATSPMDGFLRQGCLLVPDTDASTRWQRIERDGGRHDVDLSAKAALDFASRAAQDFGVAEGRTVHFDKKLAKADAKKKAK